MATKRFIQREGMTLIELLIVIAIISLLMQIALPAVQQSREAARRTKCANHLRQVGMAIQNYEAASRVLPPGYVVKPYRHSLAQFVLPQLDDGQVYDNYHFDSHWNDPPNLLAVRNEINILRCPTAPRRYKYISDYGVYTQIHPKLLSDLYTEGVLFQRADTHGALRDKGVRTAAITDGLSKTIFLCETGGRPDRYEFGLRKTRRTISGSRWADPKQCFAIDYRCGGASGDLKSGSQLFNCTNKNEIYSFHPLGANFLNGDASVRYINEDIEANAFVSLLTARGDD